MKTLKNKTRCSRAAMTALLLCGAVSSTYAQTFIAPGGSPVDWYTTPLAGTISGLNIAMIDGNNTNQIFGFAYWDGSSTGSFMISDASLGNVGLASISGSPTGRLCNAEKMEKNKSI